MKLIRLALITLVLQGCKTSYPPDNDPALEFQLKEQSDDYAGIAQWAHQYMHIEKTKDLLTKKGYQCLKPTQNKANIDQASDICIKPDFMLGTPTIYLTKDKQTGFLTKVEGKRLFGFFGRLLKLDNLFSSTLTVPGVNYIDLTPFVNFVVDTLKVSSSNPCRGLKDYAIGHIKTAVSQCKKWRQARQSGWPRWDGQPVDLDEIQSSLKRLQQKGFSCPKLPTRNRYETLPVFLDKNIAWIECSVNSFSKQKQAVFLGLRAEDSALVKVRVKLANELRDIPVKLLQQKSHPGERQVLVRTVNNEIIQIKLALGEGEVYQNKLIPDFDLKSRQRLLKVSAWQAKITLGSYQKFSTVPKIQALDRVAYLFARLGSEVLKEWRTSLIDLNQDSIAAIVIAECMQQNKEQTVNCFLFHLGNNPKLEEIYSLAIREIYPFIEKLPEEHPVRQRIGFLSNAVAVYRQFKLVSWM